MERLYIKFEEGNKDSLEKAIEIAKGLGYKEFKLYGATKLKGMNLLILDDVGDYWTTAGKEKDLIKLKYKEYKETFKEGDEIKWNNSFGRYCYQSKDGTHLIQTYDDGFIRVESIEKVEEIKYPKYRVGDYVVAPAEFNQHKVNEYIKINSIQYYKGEYWYNTTYTKSGNSYLTEKILRKPTEQELLKFYR